MKQSYRAVLCDGTDLLRVVPSTYNVPNSLLEQCQIGNPYVNVSYMMLSKRPMRVCWMGEQADYPFDPDVDAYANALPEEEFRMYYAMAWENTSFHCEIPLGTFRDDMLRKILNLRTTGFYLINHTRRTFIDMAAYLSCNQVAGRCCDPLPLLTACGNGRGKAEFPAEQRGYELIGTWAFDLLEYSQHWPGDGFLPVTVFFEQSALVGKLTGKSFVVTGKVSGYTRGDIEDLIKQKGGQVDRSVTRSTDYLVVAEKPGKTKLNAAAKYGTRKISESELFNMMNA